MKTICYLTLALVIAVIVLATTGCVSRLYDHGQLTAEIRGDYEYRKSADGAVSVSLQHTPVIQAGGNAASKIVGATGTAASAAVLFK